MAHESMPRRLKVSGKKFAFFVFRVLEVDEKGIPRLFSCLFPEDPVEIVPGDCFTCGYVELQAKDGD